MKKIIAPLVIAVAVLFTSFSTQAQTSTHGKHGNGTEMKQMLKDSLHLTDAQVDSVTSIRQEFRDKIKTVMQNSSLSADEKREQMKPLRQEMKTRLSAVLTKEQMKKMREMQQEMRGGKNEDGK